MRKAIGVVIMLIALSHFFNRSLVALDGAASESFKTIEAAAIRTQQELQL